MGANATQSDPGLLTCWKDIARHMGKGVRTVQRWEQKFGLPVRRPLGATHKSVVIAHPHDLDAWLEIRWTQRAQQKSVAPASQIIDPDAFRNFSSGMRTSRELRSANHALLHEISTALHMLVKNCDQLAASREKLSLTNE